MLNSSVRFTIICAISYTLVLKALGSFESFLDEDVGDTCGYSRHESTYIYSPGYPSNYPNLINCEQVFEALPNSYVSIQFHDFNLELSDGCKYDSLEIRDGPFGFSPILFRGCGNQITNGTTFNSTQRYLRIKFQTDLYISKRGFFATTNTTNSAAIKEKVNIVEEYTNNECYMEVNSQSRFSITEKNISASALRYIARNPTKAVDCIWVINMENTHFKMLLRVHNYSRMITLSCDANYMAFYEGSSLEANRRFKACRTVPVSYISQTSRVILQVHAKAYSAIPAFRVIGNVYISAKLGNCSRLISCHDGYCIPSELACDGESNCSGHYDEECSPETEHTTNSWQYLPLFLMVILGSVFLTTTMTIVRQYHWNIKRERAAVQRDTYIQMHLVGNGTNQDKKLVYASITHVPTTNDHLDSSQQTPRV